MTEPTSFLYPFIEAEERDAEALIDALTASAAEKVGASRSLIDATIAAHLDVISAAADDLSRRYQSGGRLFCIGNGGSATDAAAAASLFGSRGSSGRALPARSLAADAAILTALANDVGFDLIFTRQLIAHAGPGDAVLALSTSGNSPNVASALAHARKTGMGTIGLAGHDGGTMAAPDAVEHLIVVRSDSVHRIQEAQAAVAHRLWSDVHARLGSNDDSTGHQPGWEQTSETVDP